MSQTLVGNLGDGQQLFLEQQGTQTVITLAHSAPGQQQSQRSSFLTGAWTADPLLLKTAIGWVIQIQAQQGNFSIQLQGSTLQLVANAAQITGTAVPLQLQDAPAQDLPPISPLRPLEPIVPMTPMAPMAPLKMGNLEMQMQPGSAPMTMRMGNLEMKMGNPSAELNPESASGGTPAAKFCSQCGQPVQPDDKFCSQCGHALRSL